MGDSRYCNRFLDENFQSYVVEYRGDFKGQISKVDYACGDVITDTLGIISVGKNELDRLRRDVPGIIFMESRSIYVLQDVNPTDSDNIYIIKSNPYLNLNGRRVLVGIVDSGIDYLNREFMREDDTSRIISIWD